MALLQQCTNITSSSISSLSNALIIYNAFLFTGCSKTSSKKDLIIRTVAIPFTISRIQLIKNSSSKVNSYRNDTLQIIIPKGTYFKVTRVTDNNKGTYAVFIADREIRFSSDDFKRLFYQFSNLSYITLELASSNNNNYTYNAKYMDLTETDMMFKGFKPVKVKGFAYGNTVNKKTTIEGKSKDFQTVSELKMDNLRWSTNSNITANEDHEFSIRIAQGIPTRISPNLCSMVVPKGSRKGNPGLVIQLNTNPSLTPTYRIQLYKKNPLPKVDFSYLKMFSKVEKGNTLLVTPEMQK